MLLTIDIVWVFVDAEREEVELCEGASDAQPLDHSHYYLD